ncbi:MAG: hypothetical protein ACYC6C_08900 [Coriobacteriia bacterium]
MAQAAARRMTTSSRAARPRLHVVRRTQAPRSSARYAARCRQLFMFACMVLIAASIFGVARVTLAAQAAATAIESGRLNSEIKAERLVGDLLECDKSALSTPSRIECIAGESLQMAQAPQVAYLELPASIPVKTSSVSGSPVVVVEEAESTAVQTTDSAGFSGMLASVMEMATGEAEVLLVGDAGLASTR